MWERIDRVFLAGVHFGRMAFGDGTTEPSAPLKSATDPTQVPRERAMRWWVPVALVHLIPAILFPLVIVGDVDAWFLPMWLPFLLCATAFVSWRRMRPAGRARRLLCATLAPWLAWVPFAIGVAIVMWPAVFMGVGFYLSEIEHQQIVQTEPRPGAPGEAVVTLRPVGAYTGGYGYLLVDLRYPGGFSRRLFGEKIRHGTEWHRLEEGAGDAAFTWRDSDRFLARANGEEHPLDLPPLRWWLGLLVWAPFGLIGYACGAARRSARAAHP